MIPYLGCNAAQEMLEASVDGELPVAGQVMLEAHLRWCDTCLAHVEDMRLIGAALRLGSAALSADPNQTAALTAMQSEVLARIGTEREQALGVRCRRVFSDMRFLWPALGATMALVVCVAAVTAVNAFVRSQRPDSMAGLIATLASPGSDANPLDFDSNMLAPRTVDVGPALDSIPEGDAMFAVAAVVTREGRVANYELLSPRGESALYRADAAHRNTASALLDALKYSRFEPARTRQGAVAVNVVWLFTRTTVKGSAAKSLNDELARPVLRPARS